MSVKKIHWKNFEDSRKAEKKEKTDRYIFRGDICFQGRDV
jgi:hypothetical protein